MKKLDRELRASVIGLFLIWAAGYTIWEYRELIKPISYKIFPVPLTNYKLATYFFSEILSPCLVAMLCFIALFFLYSYVISILCWSMTKTRALFMRHTFIEKHILKVEQIFILCITVITVYLTKDWGLSMFQNAAREELNDVLVLGASYVATLGCYPVFLYFFVRSFYYFLLLGIDLKRAHFLHGKKFKQL